MQRQRQAAGFLLVAALLSLTGCEDEAKNVGATTQPASFEELKKHRAAKITTKWNFDNAAYVLEFSANSNPGGYLRVTKEVFNILKEGDRIGIKLEAIEAAMKTMEQFPSTEVQKGPPPPDGAVQLTREQLKTTYGVVKDKLGDFCHERYAIVIERDGVRLRFRVDAQAYDDVDIGTKLPLKQ